MPSGPPDYYDVDGPAAGSVLLTGRFYYSGCDSPSSNFPVAIWMEYRDRQGVAHGLAGTSSGQKTMGASGRRRGSSQLAEYFVRKRVDVAGMPDKIFGKLKSLTADHYIAIGSELARPRFHAPPSITVFIRCTTRRIWTIASRNQKAPEADTRPGQTAACGGGRHRQRHPARHDHRKYLALVSAADTQSSPCRQPPRALRVDATEVTFPFKPGDYMCTRPTASFPRSGAPRGGHQRDYLHSWNTPRAISYSSPVGAARPRDPLRGAGGKAASYPPEHGRLGSEPRTTPQNHRKEIAFDLRRVRPPRRHPGPLSPGCPWRRARMEKVFATPDTTGSPPSPIVSTTESPRRWSKPHLQNVSFNEPG